MSKCNLIAAALLLIAGLFGCGAGGGQNGGGGPKTVVVEHTDYHQPPKLQDDVLADDRLEDKQTTFDAELIDRRPLGDWRINQSEAVVRLDVPLAKPDRDNDLLALRPSYAAALAAAKASRPSSVVLPSVNLLDGKAKQFDDGLYAAIDQAYFQGIPGALESHVNLIERLLAATPSDSSAAAYLAAGLMLAGREPPVADRAKCDELIRLFRANPALAKPIGVYTWNPTLERCWAFLRFFQQPFGENDPVVAVLVQSLSNDSDLQADYLRATDFYGKLTNPLARLTLADLVGIDAPTADKLQQLRSVQAIVSPGVSVFPPSGSRENELFERIFRQGLPPNTNLMRELVRRIRSGEVDLSPRKNSGWYDYQVYALETLLLPERGEEHDKLLLTKPYKKRMLEAFAALITKRRETHVRQGSAPTSMAAPPMELMEVCPRLRVEPCPSYFIRTARSYAFLHDFLTASLGEETLAKLHGLRADGERRDDLATELAAMRDLFYGLYLVSCEDIGHSPSLAVDEIAKADHCYDAASAWLDKVTEDADMSQDTRVAVPIFVDPLARKMRLWVTLGVRLTQLDAQFVRPPRIKPANGEGDWQTVEERKLKNAEYLIAVDEFAEVEVPTLTPPNRDELRKLADQHRTKEAIVAALEAGKY